MSDAESPKPQFRNYCSCGNCKFLGPFKYADREFDLYFCTNDGTPGLFARWSDMDVEGMPANVQEIPPYAQGSVREALWQARRQARIQKLI